MALVLSEAQVRRHLEYRPLVDAVGAALAAFSQPTTACSRLQQPLRTTLESVDGAGFFLTKPAYWADFGVFAAKVLTIYPGNTALPAAQGLVLLFDASNGRPLAVMGAEEVTARRTAAASALASTLLAPRGAACLAVLGAGVQAASHVEAHLAVLEESLRRVHVWNRTRARADALVLDLAHRLKDCKVTYHVFDSAKEAVEKADIVCTVTSSSTPVLDGDWLTRPGVHVNAVGAPRPTLRELETNVLTRSFVVADSLESAINESGDVIAAGIRVNGELGQIVNGELKVDRDNTPTVFKSLGLGIEDLVAAKLVYDAYKSHKEEKNASKPLSRL